MLDVPVTNYQPKKTEEEGEAKRPAAKKGMASSTCKAPGGRAACCLLVGKLGRWNFQVWNNHSENSDQEPEYQGRTVHYKGKGDMKVL